ncbi:acetyl/propionyl/methylcrotonyl-CoA carboxylase subunit alpha [Achromobacter sp. NPDC058515]|uniref:acetyl/propionyl/methylcrotonyl-CoA carboxylase subunit alpha n=1 Tax=Achromobacter sp. NPDC058515 TaxID=3346533 RepID=UPI00365FB58D
MTVPKQIRPFHTVLIANRGEIAIRISRTLRALGYGSVAVYSDADANAPHVREADSAVRIGASPPGESYLNIRALLRAAHQAGADAIHPGYGFLAENDAFADAVDAAGLVFIGPSGESIRAMGNKAHAKRVMERAEMPCIPGYQGVDQSDEAFVQAAGRIGFPVMVKAAAGGGGRGMRLVHDPAQLAAALASARSEAESAFGSGELILEKALLAPRHVEIQILADSRGHTIHLGERDCSVQRRHQKLIEESPSPALDADLRARMGLAAVRSAQAIGYIGAGTMEFLLDTGGAFYFMEMNTRLQVEHAVTEAVTGLDLVEWQLRIAAGEALAVRQEDVRLQGHAIEVRLTAEDVPAGFLPQTGPLLRWRAPPCEAGVRIDHGLREGGSIAPYYDSMIAKLIAHGATREEARRKLLRALRQCVVLGVPTNQGFLADCLSNPVFADGGQVHTGFVAEQFGKALHLRPAPLPSTLALAGLAAYAHAMPVEPGNLAIVPAPLTSPPWTTALSVAGMTSVVRIQPRAGEWAVEVSQADAEPARASHPVRLRDACWTSPGRARLRVECDGMLETAVLHIGTDTIHIFHGARAWSLARVDAHKRRAAAHASGTVTAPLTGRVVQLLATVGSIVKTGDALLVLEAMKMEHTLEAPVPGTVVEVSTELGGQAAKDMPLLRIEAAV